MHSLAKIAIRVKAFGIEDAVVFDVVAINVVMFYDAGAAAELLRGSSRTAVVENRRHYHRMTVRQD